MPSWLLRGVLTELLAAAGVLTFAAARERWWPACPRGDFDSAPCVRVQSHDFDYLVPTAPWEPVGAAAELAGLSLLVLALAALIVPFVLRPRSPGRWAVVSVLVAVVPAAALTVLGLATVRAGLTGLPTAPSAVLGLAFFVWAVAWPAALIGFACLAPGRTHRAGAVTLAALLVLSTPAPVLLVLGPTVAGYLSHDTAPWTEATAAPILFAAAVAVWPATVPLRRPRLPRPLSGAAASGRRILSPPTPSPGSPGGPRRGSARTGGVGSARS